MQKLPIGKSNFKVIIEDGFYYIDKSLFIKEVLQNSSDVSLIPRPRRFGKTLNLNLLYYFFENQERNEHLFRLLAIYQEEEFLKHFGKYPVIYLSFKDIKSYDFKTAKRKIKHLIINEFARNELAVKQANDKVLADDLVLYDRILHREAEIEEYENALKLLSKVLTLTHNQRCIILIDEYDTPIQTGFINGYYNEIISFFKSFLGAALKDNETFFYKAVITGILRVSKESIFSDLNNISVFTSLDERFSDKFGLTTPEVEKALAHYQLRDTLKEVNHWYNGYKMGNTVIFNPWSILCYIDRRELNVYWANTSSNDIIKILVENSETFKHDLKVLLNYGSVKKVINPNITFKNKDFNFDEETLYSFLFFSGYLKCENKQLIMGEYHCQLSIVNLECYSIFKKIIYNWVNASFVNRKLKLMLKSLVNADLSLFEEIFSDFVRNTLSYFDTGKNVESVYHAFLLGLLVNLMDYEVISNQESGYGRFDIMILHKKDKSKAAIIMELKTISQFRQETKDTALDSALKQIEEQQYETKARLRGYENIVKCAAVFDGKRVWIKAS